MGNVSFQTFVCAILDIPSMQQLGYVIQFAKNVRMVIAFAPTGVNVTKDTSGEATHANRIVTSEWFLLQ